VTAAEVSVAIVDDPAIHTLNRQFLDHDEPTDVLSFSLHDEKSGGSTEGQIDGEIVLSAETARRRAAEFHWSPRDEVVLYLVHGLLHLAGHDDQTPEDRTAMRTREQTVLAHWGLSPRYDEDGPASAVQRGPADSNSQFSIFNSQFSISAPNVSGGSRGQLKNENCKLKNENLTGRGRDNPRPSSAEDIP
jgi:probable rRNA maturation factor